MLSEKPFFLLSRQSQRAAWFALFLIVLLAALLVWAGPQEKTLGNGIKPVYVHVSLTWAGLVGFIAAGLLGLVALFRPRPATDRWRVVLGWVGFGFYLGGMAVSAVASRVNWGAVFWQEPRMVTALNVLAVALLVQTAALFLPWLRLRGLLSVALPLFIFWANANARLVLHPGSAVRDSAAPSIQLTFLGMFLLALAAEGILVWLAQSD